MDFHSYWIIKTSNGLIGKFALFKKANKVKRKGCYKNVQGRKELASYKNPIKEIKLPNRHNLADM